MIAQNFPSPQRLKTALLPWASAKSFGVRRSTIFTGSPATWAGPPSTATSCWPPGCRYAGAMWLAICVSASSPLAVGFQLDHSGGFAGLPAARKITAAATAASPMPASTA